MNEDAGVHWPYKSYVIRLWREELHAPWRASAKSVQTGETVTFASVIGLFAFLSEQAPVSAPDFPAPSCAPTSTDVGDEE